MGYGSQRAVLLFKCAACAVVLAVAGMARSCGVLCCLCEAVRPWQSMLVTPRGVLQNRMACKVDCRVATLLAMTVYCHLLTTQRSFFYHYTLLLAEHI